MKAGRAVSLIAFMLMKELELPLRGGLTLTVASDGRQMGKNAEFRLSQRSS